MIGILDCYGILESGLCTFSETGLFLLSISYPDLLALRERKHLGARLFFLHSGTVKCEHTVTCFYAHAPAFFPLHHSWLKFEHKLISGPLTTRLPPAIFPRTIRRLFAAYKFPLRCRLVDKGTYPGSRGFSFLFLLSFTETTEPRETSANEVKGTLLTTIPVIRKI